MVRTTLVQKWFKDKDGNIELFQPPSWTLIGWVAFKVLSYFPFSSPMQNGLSFLSTAFLFTWAYLEITSGVNYFRRALGAAVLIAVVIPHF